MSSSHYLPTGFHRYVICCEAYEEIEYERIDFIGEIDTRIYDRFFKNEYKWCLGEVAFATLSPSYVNGYEVDFDTGEINKSFYKKVKTRK